MNEINIPQDIIAVIPAAGIGSRMQCACPKQYLTLGTKTVLEHAIAPLLNHPRVRQIIIAISPDDTYFHQLALADNPRILVATGGAQRADSVLAGLSQAHDIEWVLVHDAARPCLHPDDLERLLAITTQTSIGGILAAPVRDTMKRGECNSGSSCLPIQIAQTVDRENLWHALTPQLFPLTLLRDCLSRALEHNATVTDEASALEFCGYHPLLVHGRSDNIKITRSEDLDLAAFYLSRLANKETL